MVEDHPPLATVVAIGLRRSGHDVVRVGSVERALATEGTFACAVLDIDLPDGSGVDLAKHLLDDARTECVVFYTATRDGALRRSATKLGPVVDKLSNLDELLGIVEHEIERFERIAQAVGAAAPVSPGRASQRSGTRRRVT